MYSISVPSGFHRLITKPFLSELEQNEEQMNKVYQRQIEEIEYQMLEEKKEYLKQIELLEAEYPAHKKDKNER